MERKLIQRDNYSNQLWSEYLSFKNFTKTCDLMKVLSKRSLCKDRSLRLSYISFLVNLPPFKRKAFSPKQKQVHTYIPILKVHASILFKNSLWLWELNSLNSYYILVLLFLLYCVSQTTSDGPWFTKINLQFFSFTKVRKWYVFRNHT